MTVPAVPAISCAVCATKAATGRGGIYAGDWPVTEIAGRQVHKACAHEAESLARTVAEGGLLVGADGVGRWVSSGSVVPGDCAVLLAALGLADGLDIQATAVAREIETREAIERYRAAQPTMPSAEEMNEMRAAFGPGADVVDVITGRTVRT